MSTTRRNVNRRDDVAAPADISTASGRKKGLHAAQVPVGRSKPNSRSLFAVYILHIGSSADGRIDAVYKNGDGTFDVVDWKTGSAKSGDELANAAIQLAVYRLAFAEIEDVELSKVRAAFYYVSSEETVRPSDLLDYDGLLALINRVPVESK